MAHKIRTRFGDRPKAGVYLMDYHFGRGIEDSLDWTPLNLVFSSLRFVIDDRTDVSVKLDEFGQIEVMAHAAGMSDVLAFLPSASNVGRLRVIERAEG